MDPWLVLSWLLYSRGPRLRLAGSKPRIPSLKQTREGELGRRRGVGGGGMELCPRSECLILVPTVPATPPPSPAQTLEGT